VGSGILCHKIKVFGVFREKCGFNGSITGAANGTGWKAFM
jgi:hypothetical protein